MTPEQERLLIATAQEKEAFAKEIASIYASLAAQQEPLGAEFEAVWDQNTDKLYEASGLEGKGTDQ